MNREDFKQWFDKQGPADRTTILSMVQKMFFHEAPYDLRKKLVEKFEEHRNYFKPPSERLREEYEALGNPPDEEDLKELLLKFRFEGMTYAEMRHITGIHVARVINLVNAALNEETKKGDRE